MIFRLGQKVRDLHSFESLRQMLVMFPMGREMNFKPPVGALNLELDEF